jgi:hypothetical protein
MGVLHRLCRFSCPAPRRAVVEPALAAATTTANLFACCIFEVKCRWACAHDKISHLHWKHETYTTHLCCSDTMGRLLIIFVFTASFFLEVVFQFISSLMSSKRSYKRAGNKGFVCLEKDKRQGESKVNIYIHLPSFFIYEHVSTYIHSIQDLGKKKTQQEQYTQSSPLPSSRLIYLGSRHLVFLILLIFILSIRKQRYRQ